MAQLPFPAHGDTIPVVKISPKYEGVGNARHVVGAQINGVLLFDNCAQVPVTILGLDTATLPSPEAVTERNMKMQFLMAKFQDLVITISGGDYGTIRYKGTASGVEFLNLNTALPQAHNTLTK